MEQRSESVDTGEQGEKRLLKPRIEAIRNVEVRNALMKRFDAVARDISLLSARGAGRISPLVRNQAKRALDDLVQSIERVEDQAATPES